MIHENNKQLRLPKFADPLSDAGFKAVLGAAENMDILKRLLNLVLPEDRQIEEIESLNDREIDGLTPSSRYSRIDLRCRDKEGRDFVIEMQRRMHDFFFQRCVWYGSNVYGHDLVAQDDFDCLKPVFVVAFLEGKLPHKDESKWNSTNFISCYRMTEKNTGEVAPDTIMCIFVELGRFRKKRSELNGTLDRTCYLFKNMGKWGSSVPKEVLEDDFTADLTRACEVANFSDEVKLSYIKDMFTELDYKAEMKASFDEGAESEKYASARRMLEDGMNEDLVSRYSGLSVEEIRKL